MAFGRLIRRTREDRNMTLMQLALRAKTSIVYLSRIEREREKPPPDRLLIAIADVLELSHDQAFAAAGRLPPDLQARAIDVIATYRAHVAAHGT
jgi:transcriptional regulator with XRE-family HTH domain